ASSGSSGGFPTTAGAFETTFSGAQAAFALKLNSSGNALLYSTVLGGTSDDVANGIAIDSSGNAYIAGQTGGSFPTTTGAFQTVFGGATDAFVTKLNSSGTALVYSTYLGGANNDLATGIALDSGNHAYVSGVTFSAGLATANAAQTQCGKDGSCDGGNDDAFVAELNTLGSGEVYFTYVGGAGQDDANRIAVDSSGAAYITGKTNSGVNENFPIVGSPTVLQGTLAGSQNAFITKVHPGGSSFDFSTYVGGNGLDEGLGIALDSSDNVYITGWTSSSNFPLLSALACCATLRGPTDAFVTEVTADGSSYVFSTYFGGTGNEDVSGGGIAVDASSNVYVTGDTDSNTASFPLVNAAQGFYGAGVSDAFVAKLSPGSASLTVSTNGTGAGTVTSSPAGINCPTTCSANFADATTVTLTAAPLAGSTFSGWSGACNNTGTTCIVDVTAAQSVTATFNLAGTPDFLISASALSPTTVNPGGSATSTVTITATGGFTGAVALSCTGLPAGASCGFVPPSVTGSGSSTLTITTTGATPVGVYNVQVTGTSGSLSHSATVVLDVQTADFTISASAPAAVTAGGSTTSTVTITSVAGFAGAVSLSCSNLPAGASCSFVPSPVTGGSGTSTLTINTTNATANGSYNVTVKGISGSLTHSTTITLNVGDFTISASPLTPGTVSPGGSATSTVTVTGASGFNPSTVALSCSSVTPTVTLPPTCSFSALTGSGSTYTSTLTVRTSAPSAHLTNNSGLYFAMWLPIGGIALLGAGFNFNKKHLGLMLGCLMIFGLMFLTACGGGSSSSGGNHSSGTPAGTYSITVTGTEGGIVHNASPITLTVN
ncbi:MAG: SBBP repeat-containing protein, partial [Acidobacteriales bacterium]|nr:SBBP repeat-containing protein [Terriglobales bacterium]